ncbi:MAG: 50S ribosomal protein L18 [Verrucomicrobia bacterium]|nr:50S ribosomal protein L18 [Verrucomicrobiota bacterium]MBV8378443.1 50S ribosomal protein L18 [Verrucomicrobiota bacterium]
MEPIDRIKIRHTRIRRRVTGTSARPRLAVHFSGQHIYAQVIDDSSGNTMAAASTVEPGVKGKSRTNAKVSTAEKIGALVAERSLQKNIKAVVFDRGGFRYHGKVKALADAARAAGLEF